MATLPTLNGASPLDADDGSYLTFSQDATETRSSNLDNTPADFGTMDTGLTWEIVYSLTNALTNDTYALAIRIVSGATILAAADSGGTFTQVDPNVNSTLDSTGSDTFAYVNTTADKATWDAATIELRQTHTKNQGFDTTAIQVDYAAFDGTYTTASTNTNVNANTDALTLTEQAATVSLDREIVAGTDALTLTERTATITAPVNTNVLAGTAGLSLTTFGASVGAGTTVAAAVAALTLSVHAATITSYPPAVDEVGTYDGTYLGNPTLGSTALIDDGGADTSVTFDGAGDYVELGSIGSAATLAAAGGTVTIEAWINQDAGGDSLQRIFEKGSSGAAVDGYGMYVEPTTGEVTLAVNGTSVSTSSGLATTGSTHHIVGIIRADGSWNVYVDDTSAGSGAASALPAIPSATANARLGAAAYAASNFFDGRLDEVAIYGDELTTAEITEHYNFGAPTHVTVNAATDALTLTTLAASVGSDTNVSTNVDALTLTTFAAGVSIATQLSATFSTTNADTADADVHVSALSTFSTTNADTASISAHQNIPAGVVALTVTGLQASVGAGVNVQAGTDAMTLTAFPAAVAAGSTIAASTAILTLTTHAAGVRTDTSVSANTASLTLTTYPATLSDDTNVSAGTVSLTLTTFAAGVNAGLNVAAGTDALTLTTYPVAVAAGNSIVASTAVLTLSTLQATVEHDIIVAAGTDALVLATYGATVSLAVSSDTNVAANVDALTLSESAATVAYYPMYLSSALDVVPESRRIQEGDTTAGRMLSSFVVEGGGPVSLINAASVTLTIKEDDNTLILDDGSCEIVDAENGIVEYIATVISLTEGSYRARWEITWTHSAGVSAVPTRSYALVEVTN